MDTAEIVAQVPLWTISNYYVSALHSHACTNSSPQPMTPLSAEMAGAGRVESMRIQQLKMKEMTEETL